MIYRGLPGASGHYDAHFQRRNGLSHTRRTEASVASVGFIQFVYLYEVNRGDFLDDELGYAVAFVDLDVV